MKAYVLENLVLWFTACAVIWGPYKSSSKRMPICVLSLSWCGYLMQFKNVCFALIIACKLKVTLKVEESFALYYFWMLYWCREWFQIDSTRIVRIALVIPWRFRTIYARMSGFNMLNNLKAMPMCNQDKQDPDCWNIVVHQQRKCDTLPCLALCRILI